MADSEESYVVLHRIPEIVEHLCFAILQHKPADHVAFTKRWLGHLKYKMQCNGSSTAKGINLFAIDGTRPPPKFVEEEPPSETMDQSEGVSPVAFLTKKAKRHNRTKPERAPAAAALVTLIDKLDPDDYVAAYKALDALRRARETQSSKDQQQMKTKVAEISLTSQFMASTSEGPKRREAISATPIEVTRIANYKAPVVSKPAEELKQLATCVESSTLFSAFEEEQRQTVIDAMVKQEFPAGQEILSQHGPSRDTLFLIISGTVEVFKDKKIVATMGPKEYFGELELMYNVPNCEATVRTVGPVVTYTLEKETYQNIVLHSTLERRDIFLKQIQKVRVFESIPEYDKRRLAEALKKKTYNPDEYLIRCGEAGRWMFIIMKGVVRVVGRKDGRKVDVVDLGEGEVVGELEFLFNHNAIADVVAKSTVVVAMISRSHFEMCMGPLKDNLKHMISPEHYKHYLEQAGEEVIKEIHDAEERSKRKRGGVVTFASPAEGQEFSSTGEIVFGGPAKEVYRFSFDPTKLDGLAAFALEENGSILFWNDVMVKTTQYQQQEVVGTSIFTLLEQDCIESFHNLINEARKWAGNYEGFIATGTLKRELLHFSHRSGLSRSQMALSVFPAVIAQPGNQAEILLCMGHEAKKSLAATATDFGSWFVSALKPKLEELNNRVVQLHSSQGEKMKETMKALEDCFTVVSQFEPLALVDSDIADSWQAVGIHVLMNRFITELTPQIRARNNNLVVEVDTSVPSEEVYLDVTLLPQTIQRLATNCNSLGTGITITITASLTESEDATRFINYTVSDTVPLEEEISLGESTREAHSLSQTVALMGGVLTVRHSETGSEYELRFPFVAAKASSPVSSDVSHGKGFTTVMVESSAMHRNMMCHQLWGRKHAVLPANSWNEILSLIEGGKCDILIIDPESIVEEDYVGSMEIQDPMERFAPYSHKIVVIISSENFTEQMLAAQSDQNGVLALPKPCNAARLHNIIQRAEKIVGKRREEAEKISEMRETFSKTNRGEHKIGRLLGKGAFGEVYEVEDVLTKGKMAMKQLRLKTEEMANELLEEIQAMTTLQHVNIIHYFYCEKVGSDQLRIFMELAPGGTLKDRIKKTEPKSEAGGMPADVLAKYLGDVLNGLAYIHSLDYVHSDLKTDNVLLDADGRGKLGDFGTCKKLKPGEKMYVMQGTPSYMAPEVMNVDREEGIGYDSKADIWSLGCIVMEMATGRPPFSQVEGSGGLGLIKYISALTDTPDLSSLFDASPLIFEFVKACLEVDPAKRPSASELLNFSLMTGGGEENATAEKLIQRAKLLHILNAFVAFQDPDDVPVEQKAEEAELRTLKEMTDRGGFFDSDEEHEGSECGDDDDEDSDEVMRTQPKAVTAWGVGRETREELVQDDD